MAARTVTTLSAYPIAEKKKTEMGPLERVSLLLQIYSAILILPLEMMECGYHEHPSC